MSFGQNTTGKRFRKKIKEIIIKHNGHIKLKKLYKEISYEWNTPIVDDVLIFTICNMLDEDELNLMEKR